MLYNTYPRPDSTYNEIICEGLQCFGCSLMETWAWDICEGRTWSSMSVWANIINTNLQLICPMWGLNLNLWNCKMACYQLSHPCLLRLIDKKFQSLAFISNKNVGKNWARMWNVGQKIIQNPNKPEFSLRMHLQCQIWKKLEQNSLSNTI